MSNPEELIKKANLQEIATKGSEIYEKVKLQYEPKNNGKFLAIDVESGAVYLGASSSDAVQLARQSHPDRVFYVVKIGYSATEILAHMSSE